MTSLLVPNPTRLGIGRNAAKDGVLSLASAKIFTPIGMANYGVLIV